MTQEVSLKQQAWQALHNITRAVDTADDAAAGMATLLVGRMRKVYSHGTLCKLKRELANYNMQTGRWSE